MITNLRMQFGWNFLEHYLEDLAEEELGEVPVVLPQRDHEAVHGQAPPLQLVVVLPDLVQAEARDPPALQVVPQEGRHQERHGLTITSLLG